MKKSVKSKRKMKKKRDSMFYLSLGIQIACAIIIIISGTVLISADYAAEQAARISIVSSDVSQYLLAKQTFETDYNSDGLPDVISTFTFINDTRIEVYVNDTRETGGYKWASAICGSSDNVLDKWEYNPSTEVWTNTGPLNYDTLAFYGLPSDWCEDYGGEGFVLFGAGSGDKTYRIDIQNPEDLIFHAGKGTEDSYVVYATESRVDFEAFPGVNISSIIEMNVSGDFELYPDEIFVSFNKGKWKQGANVSSMNETDWNQFRYTFWSTSELKNINNRYFYKSGREGYEVNLMDICNAVGPNNESADCQIRTYITSEMIDVDGESINHTTGYYLEVIFYSGNVIDPSYTLSVLDDEMILQDVVFEGGNYTHLNVSATAPYDNLVAYWSFDADQLDTFATAYDLTKNANDATASGDATNVSGIYGDALSLDGTGDYMEVTNFYSDADDWENGTITLWFKSVEGPAGTNLRLISFGNSTTNRIEIYMDNLGRLWTFGRNDTGTQFQILKDQVGWANDSAWHFAALRWKNNNVSLWVDGADSGYAPDTSSGMVIVGSPILRIGEYAFGTGNSWNGSMDDVMFFNEFMSYSDINDIYTNASARFKATGTETHKQIFNASGYNTMNVSLDNYQANYGTNVSIKAGYWDVSRGYNETDFNNQEGLVAYWHCDGDWTDAMGASNLVSAGGSPQNDNETERYSTSCYFNGTSNVRTNDIDGYFNDTATISGWIKSDREGVINQGLWAFDDGGSFSHYPFTSPNNIYLTTFRTDQINCGALSSWTNITQWHHLVIRTQPGAGGWDVFVNGVQKCTTTGENAITIGTSPSNYNYLGTSKSSLFFRGNMDEVMLWNRSISDAEIKELYLKGRADWGFTSAVQPGQIVSVPDTTTLHLPQLTLDSDANQFYTPYVISGGDISLTFGDYGFSCTSGTPDTTCYLNTTYFYTDTELINATGKLVIQDSGSIESPTAQSALTLNWDDGIEVLNGGKIEGGSLTIITPNLTVESGGTISANELGYPHLQGPGNGQSSNRCGSGGSHAGDGGDCYNTGPPAGFYGTTHTTYGSTLTPNTFGSGGGDSTSETPDIFGGAGGGIIRLDIEDTVNISGTLSANGGDGIKDNNYDISGGGAGGSIWVTSTTFYGTGTITATGGDSFNSNVDGGAGGGGRVAIYFNESSYDSSTYSAAGGTIDVVTYFQTVGKDGSFILVDEDDDVVEMLSIKIQDDVGLNNETITNGIYSGSGVWDITNLIVNNDTTFSADGGNASLTAAQLNGISTGNLWFEEVGFRSWGNGNYIFPAVNLTFNNSRMDTIARMEGIGITSTGSLHFLAMDINVANFTVRAQNITLDSNTDVNGDYLGYAGATVADSNGDGPGGGTFGANAACGASHGGDGGQGVANGANGCSPPLAYGNETNASQFGSGGASGTSGLAGGDGGGIVFLNATDTLKMDSILSVDGAAGATGSNPGAGGSGGSVWLIGNVLLTGSGTITATGGFGGDDADDEDAGGGAGGRVALLSNNTIQLDCSSASINVSGGAALGTGPPTPTAGGDGTIYCLPAVITNLAPTVTLIAPGNGTSVDTAAHYFAANFTDDSGLDNLTFYLWNSTGSTINTTFSVITGTFNESNISVTLPYEGTFEWNYESYDNESSSSWATNNFTIIYETAPEMNYVSPTLDNNTYINSNYIEINVTATSATLDSITISLYNSTDDLINQTITTSSPNYINVSGLAEGSYYYNSTANNSYGFSSVLERRDITLDSTAPNVTLNTPENNTITTETSQNLTANLTDNIGVKNATLYIYNETGSLVNETTTTFSEDVSQAFLGVIYVFVDGVYEWFYKIFDWSGNSAVPESNYTITVDSTAPTLTIYNPTATTYRNQSVLINFTSPDAYDTLWYYNGTANNTYTSEVYETLGEGNYLYYFYVNDSLNNVNSNSINFTVETLAINSVTNVPATPSPGDNVVVSVNVSSWNGDIICNITGDLGYLLDTNPEDQNVVLNFDYGTRTAATYNYNVSCFNDVTSLTQAGSVVVEPYTNLYPLSINFSDITPVIGQEIFITSYVYAADQDATNINVTFYDGSTIIGSEIIPSISKDSSDSVQINHSFITDGIHVIKTTVNEQQAITESTYADNNKTVAIVVGLGGAAGGIIVTSTLDPTTVEQYNTIDVNGTAVYNTSGFPAVAGATVTVETSGGQTQSTTTNDEGVFTITDWVITSSAGTYEVNTTVADGSVSGLDQDNLTVTSTTSTQPDFYVPSNLVFDPTKPLVDEEVNISGTIQNIGGVSGSMTARMYHAGTMIAEFNISNLASGASVPVSTLYNFSTGGFNAILLATDYNNSVAEDSETNNNRTTNVYVYQNVTDLDPTGFQVLDTATLSVENEPYVGQNVTFRVTVRNNQGLAAGQFIVNFYDNVTLLGNTTVASLAGLGTSTTTDFTYIYGASGISNLRAEVNEDQVVNESDYTNNNITASINVQASALPDLIASDITLTNLYDSNSVYEGVSVNVTATISNEGDTNTSGNIGVDFYFNGALVNSTNITSQLNVSDTATVRTSYTHDRTLLDSNPNLFNWTIAVNPTQSISEKGYSNNNRTEQYAIAMPDLEILSGGISFNESTPAENETINITVTIVNSDSSYPSLNVYFELNDTTTSTFIGSQTINVSAGGSKVVSFIYNGTTPLGEHIIRAAVNEQYKDAEEGNTNNNIATRALNVNAGGDDGVAPVVQIHEPENYSEFVKPSLDVINLTLNTTITDDTNLSSSWWSMSNGATNTTFNATNNVSTITYVFISQDEGTTVEYNLTVCGQDTGGFIGCLTHVVTIRALEGGGGPDEGGGGVVSGGGPGLNETNITGVPDEVPPSKILDEIIAFFKRVAFFINPNNPALGMLTLWAIIILILMSKYINEWIGDVKLRKEWR